MSIVARHFLFDNPPFKECHAASLTETPKGILAAFFAGSYERHPDVGIWTVRFDGERWQDLREVANGVQADGERFPTWNPVLFTMPDGEILLFYKIGPSPAQWWGVLRRSFDHGVSWTEPEPLPDGILGPIKNKPILLGATLLCPTSRESEADGWEIIMERTTDRGRTWESTGPLNDGHNPRAIQPTLLRLADNRLLALCRTEIAGYTPALLSEDGGETWGPMTTTDLPNPNCGIDGVTLVDGRHLLVYNHGVIPPGGWTQRSPINLAVSEDGAEWAAALILESQPGEYSYPAIIQSNDGLVHILYTWKRTNIQHTIVSPETLTASPIVDGIWPEGVTHA